MRTAESVTEGHPDKIADQISDSVVDSCLSQDPMSRVACEVMVNSAGTCVVAGEVTSEAVIDIEPLVYNVWPTCQRVSIDLQQQSPALAATVDAGGANDQGIVVGYACDETPEFMPLPIVLAHRLTQRLAEVRKSGILPYLLPDGKAQVTVSENGLEVVVISAQHDAYVALPRLRADIRAYVLSVVPIRPETKIFINPQAGRFEQSCDTGLTGRKIVMDAYGPQVPDGGGAFSGKDPSKLDRSGAYMARHIAKCAVATGMAHSVQIELAYAIGVREPVSIDIESDGDRYEIEAYVRSFDLTPLGIIEYLNLKRPIYQTTAAYGHFGRNEFPWEQTQSDAKNLPLTFNQGQAAYA